MTDVCKYKYGFVQIPVQRLPKARFRTTKVLTESYLKGSHFIETTPLTCDDLRAPPPASLWPDNDDAAISKPRPRYGTIVLTIIRPPSVYSRGRSWPFGAPGPSALCAPPPSDSDKRRNTFLELIPASILLYRGLERITDSSSARAGGGGWCTPPLPPPRQEGRSEWTIRDGRFY